MLTTLLGSQEDQDVKGGETLPLGIAEQDAGCRSEGNEPSCQLLFSMLELTGSHQGAA